jgi:general secretion pathway protein A
MYTKHFGLEMLPFENVPDPAFFFDQGDHARIRNRITESLKAGRGLTVVTGHIGAGKTTLSQMVISEFSDDIRFIWMAEPPENSIDLFLFIAQELGLKPGSSEKTFILRDIKEALQQINADGRKCLVIIDESHLVSDDTINGIRLLNNLEEGSKKLIQILLLGQEELAEIINRPDMEPFRQRIATLETLGKMDAERIRKYVAHRIHVAGGGPSMLSDTGWEALALAFGSGSTPRVINSLCDRALNAAFEREKTIVDVDDVYEAAQGMGLQKEIFFYKVALKKGNGNEHLPSGRGNGTTEEEKKGAENYEGLSNQESAAPEAVEHRIRRPEPVRKVLREPESSSFLSETEQKSLKTPMLLLALSIVAFIITFYFYCEKSASPGAISCLLDLLSF